MSLAFVFGVLAFFITCLASFMYVIIMGPSRYHRDGFVGKLYDRLIDFPNICCGCFCALCFGCSYVRGRQKWRRCADHTLHERNWFMVIFYVLLVWPVELLYIFSALPMLRASLFSKIFSVLLVVTSEWFYALAVFSDPGIVTSCGEKESQQLAYSKSKVKVPKRAKRRLEHSGNNKNNSSSSSSGSTATKRRNFLLSPEAEARQNERYPMDGILFAIANEKEPANVSPGVERTPIGVECITCCVPRPSRSKHCRLCNYCVRRYDHHCPWINNDVAEGTQRWFFLFLFCHAVSCTWAAWDIYVIMRDFLVFNNAWGWVLRLESGGMYQLTLADYIVILLSHHTLSMCLFLYAIAIGFVLWVFWAYQLSFVVANLTINEMNKIDDAVEFVTTLPTIDAVHSEAMKLRHRLEAIAAKPPRKLQALTLPPEETESGGRAEKQYRKKVGKALQADLRVIYDRGIWKNVMEVMSPYN